MRKYLAILLALFMVTGLVACKKPATENTDTNNEADVTDESNDNESLDVEGDPAEYNQSYWEEKYPDYNFCPFGIEENGVEKSYYWPMGYEGLDGTIATWINCPFNWNGWHMTEDGDIVNKDETLKITDDWASGAEGMSSFCTVTTEKYEKDK